MALTDEQLARRRIGGSEAAIACGFVQFGKGPSRLWAEKVGILERDEIPEQNKERVRAGELMEDVIAQLYAERMGVTVRRSNRTYTNERYPFMTAHVDRMVQGVRDAIVECKNVDSMAYARGDWGEPGTDEIPFGYLLQCHHYLVCLDRKRIDVAALVGGNNLNIYHVHRDAEMEEMVTTLEAQFWNCVETERPPPVVTESDILALYPKALGTIANCSNTMALEIQNARAYTEQRSLLTKKIDTIKLNVKRHMEGHSILARPADGTVLATWESGKDKEIIDWKGVADSLLLRLSVYDDADPMPDLIKQHTSIQPGSRTLLLKDGRKHISDY